MNDLIGRLVLGQTTAHQRFQLFRVDASDRRLICNMGLGVIDLDDGDRFRNRVSTDDFLAVNVAARVGSTGRERVVDFSAGSVTKRDACIQNASRVFADQMTCLLDRDSIIRRAADPSVHFAHAVRFPGNFHVDVDLADPPLDRFKIGLISGSFAHTDFGSRDSAAIFSRFGWSHGIHLFSKYVAPLGARNNQKPARFLA